MIKFDILFSNRVLRFNFIEKVGNRNTSERIICINTRWPPNKLKIKLKKLNQMAKKNFLNKIFIS